MGLTGTIVHICHLQHAHTFGVISYNLSTCLSTASKHTSTMSCQTYFLPPTNSTHSKIAHMCCLQHTYTLSIISYDLSTSFLPRTNMHPLCHTKHIFYCQTNMSPLLKHKNLVAYLSPNQEAKNMLLKDCQQINLIPTY